VQGLLLPSGLLGHAAQKANMGIFAQPLSCPA
jgi:hypothetical protein